MIVSVGLSGLKRTRWYEYGLRFALGGLVTAGAGLLAKAVSPHFGGLFLAFPAILAAGTTLVARHEREREQEQGQQGENLSRQTAGATAFGAAIGSLGLMGFAALVWLLLPGHGTALALGAATLAWAAISAGVWRLWKLHLPRRLRRRPHR